MDEEVRPFSRRATDAGPLRQRGRARGQVVTIGGARVLLVRSGIGLVNAAAALVAALSESHPRAVISTGSAGGLAATIEVGDIVVGDSYTYAGADATAFDYVRGQVPGMPVGYDADPDLLAAAARATAPAGMVRTGQMVSGDSFITDVNVAEVREAFPDALSTDMETTALAQVSYSYELPFLSVRGISDLCGPEAGQDFHLGVDEAAERAAAVVLAVLGA
ncbi:5'-methylthioadenosine/S-adenosylhomocysteine nucleosidase [Georgenia subflava]|uniref:adenosylhomocysteine nucleosidase n=2 Tax=Georgenia subflava TaxID=1622177 RepID=A0A6N7EJ68_9MICO|nr:5'-methylthioadenosine/S-adenosylhomocysteine nucleosidase [Georgenia subflava]